MMLLIGATIFIVLVWVYIFFLREWLDAHYPGVHTLHVWEDRLWERSRTMLAARAYTVGGIVLAIHELGSAAGLDWTPLTDQITALLPERYRPMVVPVAAISTGLMFAWLRKRTSEPLEARE